jgi:hypothetical protein
VVKAEPAGPGNCSAALDSSAFGGRLADHSKLLDRWAPPIDGACKAALTDRPRPPRRQYNMHPPSTTSSSNHRPEALSARYAAGGVLRRMVTARMPNTTLHARRATFGLPPANIGNTPLMRQLTLATE